MKASQALKGITAGFVTSRAEALKGDWSARNERMDDYEALYTLDVWEGEPKAHEIRVTSPRPFAVVEATRALMFTRRPVIEVPPSQVLSVDTKVAARIEKFLYGAWDMMHLILSLDTAEFHATCLGMGVAKVYYDPETPVGEFPLAAQALDPRNVYYSPDPRRPLQALEVAHAFKRRRRDIIADGWDVDLPGMPDVGDAQAYEDWADAEVEYVDYWCTRILEEQAEEETEPPPGATPGTLGEMLDVLEDVTRPEPEPQEETGREGDANRTRTKRRRIVNCIVADGVMVKEPAVMPGYEVMPFFVWAGVRTGLEWEDSSMSVLFPISGGVRKGGSQGTIAAENEMLSMAMRLVKQHADMAAVTNDPALASTGLDAAPGSINPASLENYRIDWIVPPGNSPDTTIISGMLQNLSEDATIPGAMMGRYDAAASGVAMSIITNPVLMRIASRQREREEVLQRLNAHILALAEEYAPLDGWPVYGRDKQGIEMEECLEPTLIKGYRRNRVKLSASLPRDTAAETMTLTRTADSKLLSRYSAIEKIQQVLDLSGQSPEEEQMRILIESLLGEDVVRKALALKALQQYDAELAAAVAAAEAPAQQALQGPPPGAPMGPMGQGPMQGMPPGVVPPQAMPQAVGAAGPGGPANMLNMLPALGTPPPPGAGGQPPGGPVR